MFINSGPNNDCKQCTESKLSQVYNAHTLTQPARTGRSHCAQAGRGRVLGLCPAVSWLVVGRVAGLAASIVLLRPRTCPCVPCRNSCAMSRASPLRIVARYCVVSRCSAVVSRPEVPPSAKIQIFVSRPCS